jgi:cobalt-zinc-cadmium efflux system outer membrane protein
MVPEKPAGTSSGSADLLQPIALVQPDKTVPATRPQRFVIPPGLPGAEAPPIRLPENKEERLRFLKELYPPLPPLPVLRPPAPGPEGRPMTLGDLQRLGLTYSPAIKNAVAAVEAAKGAVKQAGAYPNPSFFFEQDTVQTFQAGYEGVGVDQVIKTGNKLKLQEAAATMDLLNAKLALRRAQFDLAHQIRTNYFAVLVARESIRINEALYKFADDIYRSQVETVETGGFAAAYEPMQLRPLVLQARLNLIQAQNQYQASWKQLAANLGLPDMPPSELEGRVDLPVPVFKYEEVRDRVLQNHTDVLTALNSLRKAKFNLELAKVVPLPDVDVHLLVQKDYTTPPFNIVHSLAVTVPVPIWDQNKGGIKQAEGQLAQAAANIPQTRNTLINTLTDAYNRYETARQNVDLSYQQIRDQVRAYRGLRERRQKGPQGDVAFVDLVTAQQTLAGYIAAYSTALGQQWQAVVDVANLLQTDDLFQVGPQQEVAPVPDLEPFAPPHGLRSCPPPAQPLPRMSSSRQPTNIEARSEVVLPSTDTGSLPARQAPMVRYSTPVPLIPANEAAGPLRNASSTNAGTP